MNKSLQVFIAVAVVLLLAVGCNDDQDDATQIETKKVSGLITNVEARSLLELESLEVTDEEGTVWSFQASRGGTAGSGHDFPPSHLREHMVQGVPIIVTYTEADEVRTIVRLGE